MGPGIGVNAAQSALQVQSAFANPICVANPDVFVASPESELVMADHRTPRRGIKLARFLSWLPPGGHLFCSVFSSAHLGKSWSNCGPAAPHSTFI